MIVDSITDVLQVIVSFTHLFNSSAVHLSSLSNGFLINYMHFLNVIAGSMMIELFQLVVRYSALLSKQLIHQLRVFIVVNAIRQFFFELLHEFVVLRFDALHLDMFIVWLCVDKVSVQILL